MLNPEAYEVTKGVAPESGVKVFTNILFLQEKMLYWYLIKIAKDNQLKYDMMSFLERNLKTFILYLNLFPLDVRPYDSLQDLGQELLPNSFIFKVHRNDKIDSLSYVKFCQEFNFEDKNEQAIPANNKYFSNIWQNIYSCLL